MTNEKEQFSPARDAMLATARNKFKAGDRIAVEIPEWRNGKAKDDPKAFDGWLYIRPFTVADHRRAQPLNRIDRSGFETLARFIVENATDETGRRLFRDEDKEFIFNEVPLQIWQRILQAIGAEEDAEGNSPASPD